MCLATISGIFVYCGHVAAPPVATILQQPAQVQPDTYATGIAPPPPWDTQVDMLVYKHLQDERVKRMMQSWQSKKTIRD